MTDELKSGRVDLALLPIETTTAGSMNEVYAGFFPEGARQTRTCVGVTDLVRDALVEIDCIAKR